MQMFSFCAIHRVIPPVPAAGPDLADDSMLFSVAAALHLQNGPITGQMPKIMTQKNPFVQINTEQPLIQVS